MRISDWSSDVCSSDLGGILINELAMRPHNTGHWSQDGAVTSQFENHLRAVLDLPLGSTEPRSRWTVMVNILGEIGRASCRERVCQTVWISVVAVPLKKKNTRNPHHNRPHK